MKKIIYFVLIIFVSLSLTAFQYEKEIIISENIPGIIVVQINTDKLKNKIKPYYVEHLATNREVFDLTKAVLVVNAGFFDPKNEQTVSYVTVNGNVILNPHNNKSLIENHSLKPHMNKILNRSEFRILSNNDKIKYDIAPHNAPVEAGWVIKHAIQAGPALLPEANLEEEFFVLKKDGKIISESASSLKKYPRTIIGIKNNNIYLIIATTKAPITLPDAAAYAKELGLEKAMAFDGGGSTSIDYKDLHIVSDKDSTARKLKSFLIIEQ